MSYNLYITRKEFYIDEEGQSITQPEFDEYIKEENIEKVGDDEYVWKGNPDNQSDEVYFWYEPEFGAITTKNPEQTTVSKMYHLAQKLKAEVQGEDGEVYDENGNSKHKE